MTKSKTATYTQAFLLTRAVLKGEGALLLDDLVGTVVKLSDADCGFVVLVGADGAHVVRSARDAAGRPIDEPRTSRTLVARAIAERDAIIIDEPSAITKTSAATRALQIYSAIAAPLVVAGERIGALVVHKSRLAEPFAPHARVFVEAVADLAGHALMSLRDRKPAEPVPGLVGNAPRFLEFVAQLTLAARSAASVLIEGESGTGKERAARAVHALSGRAQGPFVAVNMAALGDALAESMLFGHVKGAFTGADRSFAGYFEQANGGTIFLDEIGETPLPIQAKLLRVLQERVVRRLGATEDVPLNVRVVAATNRNLEQLVLDGRFREDLYHRLNVYPLTPPPLRERKEDIPGLVSHFLAKHGAGPALPRLSPAALDALLAHEWRGNVRELENAVERALVQGQQVIEPAHFLLRPALVRKEPALEKGDPEKERALQVLQDCEFNVVRASVALEMAAPTLYKKLQKWGVKLR